MLQACSLSVQGSTTLTGHTTLLVRRTHAADVTQSMHVLLQRGGIQPHFAGQIAVLDAVRVLLQTVPTLCPLSTV